MYYHRLQEQKAADDQKVREKEQRRAQQRQQGQHFDEEGGSPLAASVTFQQLQHRDIPTAPAVSAAAGAPPTQGQGRPNRHRSKHIVDASWLDVVQPAAPQPGPLVPEPAHIGNAYVSYFYTGIDSAYFIIYTVLDYLNK